METTYIDVPKKKWGVIVVYDYDFMDWDEMGAIMESFGMAEHDIKKSLRILSRYDTGMAISRTDLRMSVIFVSRATRPSEFWDTLNHELYHVNVAIIDYYGEPYDEEGAAYLQGYLMKQAVERIGTPCL